MLYNIKTDMPEYPKYNTVGDNVLCNSPSVEIAAAAIEYGTVFEDKTVSEDDFLDYSREVFVLK